MSYVLSPLSETQISFEGVPQLSLGEKAILTASPDYVSVILLQTHDLI